MTVRPTDRIAADKILSELLVKIRKLSVEKVSELHSPMESYSPSDIIPNSP